MDKILYFIGRFIVIVIGYVCAALIAGFFLNVMILAVVGRLPALINPDYINSWLANLLNEFWPVFLLATPYMAAVIGYIAFWPSLALIAAGEYFGKSDSLFYTVGGMLAGLLLFAYGFQPDVQNADEALMLMSCAAAGVAGGFTYWLVAGRLNARSRQEPQIR